MPSDTATIALAPSTDTFSAHDDSAYPPPSCSAFHGRSGSSECTVTTCGMSCSSPPRWPARLAYQVCECATWAPPSAATIDRSVEIVCRAELASESRLHGPCATAVDRGLPWQCTVTSTNGASSRARYSTCTPAPP